MIVVEHVVWWLRVQGVLEAHGGRVHILPSSGVGPISVGRDAQLQWSRGKDWSQRVVGILDKVLGIMMCCKHGGGLLHQ